MKGMIRQDCPCLLFVHRMIGIHETLLKKEAIAGIGDGGVNGKEMCIGNFRRNIKIASEQERKMIQVQRWQLRKDQKTPLLPRLFADGIQVDIDVAERSARLTQTKTCPGDGANVRTPPPA